MWKEKEFLKELDKKGVDTVCFMGSGYKLEDYKVGQEFYKPYAFWGNFAKQENSDSFEAVKSRLRLWNVDVTDRYRILRKYIIKPNPFYNNLQRYHHLQVINLRTKEVSLITEDYYLDFYYFYMAEPI